MLPIIESKSTLVELRHGFILFADYARTDTKPHNVRKSKSPFETIVFQTIFALGDKLLSDSISPPVVTVGIVTSESPPESSSSWKSS